MVELLPSGSDKWNWLTRRLVEFTSSGSVLIFVTKKANCEELATNLTQEGYSLGLLHGDMDQSERNKVISDFKKKNLPVLVATDVAGVCQSWRIRSKAPASNDFYLSNLVLLSYIKYFKVEEKLKIQHKNGNTAIKDLNTCSSNI